MYKFTSHLSSNRLILIRRHVGNGSCSALVMVRQPDRRYTTHKTDEQCKASPKVKSNKFFWGVVGATVLTGVAVTYAKQSPDARNFLQSNIPWASDFVAIVFQENTTYWQYAVGKFNKYSTMLSHFMFGKEGVTPLEITPKSEQDLEALAEKVYAPQTYELPPTKFEPLYVEEVVVGVPKVDGPATLIQTEKCEPTKPPVIKITKDMVELEHDMHTFTKLAIDNYKEATKNAEAYNKALFRIIEAGFDDLDKKFFSQLQSAQAARDKAIKRAKDAFGKAGCSIETLNRMIQAGGVQAPPEEITATLRYIKNFRADLSAAEKAYRAEVEKGVLADKYKSKVDAARNYYKDELRAMYPGIDLNARKMDFKGDTDLLLVYTLKQVQYLQNELAEIQTTRDAKIARAIECHDEKLLIEAKVEDMIKRDKLAMEMQYQKKALEIQAEANRNLKEQMKKALEIQQEIQADLLRKKEAEVMGQFARLVNEALEADRVKFKKELAAMAGKLLAIEQTLKQRAKAEAEARRSQSLWAAAEALLAATRRQDYETKIDSELQAVEKAGKDDKLVDTVLKGIPKEVRDKGIATEKALRDRFEQLETTASKVALVGREGASLPVYFLSWLQSKLLCSHYNEIPHKELENQPTDFTKLDTFDIIQRAKYFMQRGDLPSALKYVNLLQGGPRAAALPWLDAARRHLEIKQAAETVMAHASVSGLLYL